MHVRLMWHVEGLSWPVILAAVPQKTEMNGNGAVYEFRAAELSLAGHPVANTFYRRTQ